jgi:hypothetical protein
LCIAYSERFARVLAIYIFRQPPARDFTSRKKEQKTPKRKKERERRGNNSKQQLKEREGKKATTGKSMT